MLGRSHRRHIERGETPASESGQGTLETIVSVAVGLAILVAALVGYSWWSHRGGSSKPHAAAQSQTAVATSAAAGGPANPASPSPVAKSNPIPTATPAVAAAAGARRVRLVPFEGFSSPLAERLQAYFHDTYGIDVIVLPPISVPGGAIDAKRQQLVAERLLDALASSVPAAQLGDVTIGLTQKDMMLASTPQWQFAFSSRSEIRRAGVVSTARMDPVTFGARSDSELLFNRVVKMVSKNIGILYYRLSASNDPTSVMYANILSLDDLDRMGKSIPVP